VTWKRLANDVGRVPAYPLALAFLMGTGSQIGVVVYSFLVSMMFGLLNPYYKYMKLVTLAGCVLGSGFVNGYVNARCLKAIGNSKFAMAATFAAFIYPTIVFNCFVIVDVIEAMESSSDYFPITSMTLYFVFWFALNIPTTYYGAMLGYSQPSIA